MRRAASSPDATVYLMVLLDRMFCAVALREVVEIMRPLPLEPVAGLPPFILGVSLIRGAPAPVVDLNAVVSGERSTLHHRFVMLRIQERIVALAVKGVRGIATLQAAEAQQLPALLQQANSDVIESITRADSHLLMVLKSGHILSEKQWQALSRKRGSA